MKTHLLALYAALAATGSAALADVKLPAVIGDGMVLQQNAEVTLWGWASPGEKIAIWVSWTDQNSLLVKGNESAPGHQLGAAVEAGEGGVWRYRFKTPPAAEGNVPSQWIRIRGHNEMLIKDVLIGDVWLCSGQSNMEWTVQGAANAQEELKHADHPNIRLFVVQNAVAPEPQKDCKGSWAAASAASVKDFSATGYYFGINVQKAVNIPLGLIASDWGGTPAEAWTSEITLKTMPEWADGLAAVAKLRGDPAAIKRDYDAAVAGWLKKFDEFEPGSHGNVWSDPKLDDSDWKPMDQPKAWDGDLANFDGTVWVRRAIDVPADWAGKALTLELGPIDDHDTTWFNGVKVGEMMDEGTHATPRVYTVPAELVKAGKAVIAVRMLDTQVTGGMWGTADQLKIGPKDGKSMSLAGPWKSKVGIELAKLPRRPRQPGIGPGQPTSLYNGMIEPLTPMAIRGAIWYQGESNRDRAFQYRTLFPGMIKDWRARFGSGDFPFYFVQIAPFGYGNDKGEAAELREAQMMTLSLPNTGMAVTMDIGNPADIHPTNKQDVGRRLALWALAKNYGQAVEYSGPLYKSMKVDGSNVRLTFDHAAGLTSGDKPPSHFTIAGEDRKFVPATAVVVGETVLVASKSVSHPVAVRFAWGAADEPNLKNKAGLPASSFRTDDWPGLTQPKAKGSSRLDIRDGVMRLAAPIDRWDEGVPLGNGVMGGLLWGGGNTIRLSLDRGDLWDLRVPEAFKDPRWNYAAMQKMVAEKDEATFHQLFDVPYDTVAYPTKLPGGRLEITLPPGVAAREFRLDLRRAEAVVDFGGGELRASFDASRPIAMITIKGVEPVTVNLIRPAGLDRLGYPPAKQTSREGLVTLVQEAAENMTYAAVAGSRPSDGATTIAVTIAAWKGRGYEGDPLTMAAGDVHESLKRGYESHQSAAGQWWQKVWSGSSIRVPDAEVQAHYDLCKYFYGAASRRGSPPMPLQGLWTADEGGLPPWKGDYHNDLNTQMTYLAYPTAGLFESGESWLDFNWKLMPRYREFAKSFYGTSGAAIPGVMALDGSPLGGWGMYSLSPTMGAWVAQSFDLQRRFTADEGLLRERAYPFCSEVGTSLLALMKPDAAGKLKLPLSSSPEIFDNSYRAWLKPNSNYDLALAKWLFSTLHEMATKLGKDADAGKWAAAVAGLDDFDVEGDAGSLTFAVGEPYRESHRHFSHLMAIHPLGLLTIEGSARDRAIIDASLDRVIERGTGAWCGYSFGWFSCMLARCGRPEQALDYLERYHRGFILRNGFHCNGDQSGTGMSGFTYRPFTLEGNFLAMQAVQEMLLQSWGGVVRVFPAVSERWGDVSFENLRAEGGYSVSAKRVAGKAVEVSIVAQHAGTLRLRNTFQETMKWNRPVEKDGSNLVVSLGEGERLSGRIE